MWFIAYQHICQSSEFTVIVEQNIKPFRFEFTFKQRINFKTNVSEYMQSVSGWNMGILCVVR